jgi:hypothetical protein
MAKEKKNPTKGEKKPRPTTRKKFDRLWGPSPFMYRGIKFCIPLTPELHKEISLLVSAHLQATNYVSHQIHADLMTLKYAVTGLGNKTFLGTLEKQYEAYIRANFDLHLARHTRGATFAASRFYKGYAKRARNKKTSLPSKAPTVRPNKAMYVQDGIIKNKVTGSKLSISVIGVTEKGKARSIVVDCNVPKGMQWMLPYLTKGFGGTLSIKHDKLAIFTAKATIPFRWAYEPLMVLGTDFNRTGKSFIVLSQFISYLGEVKDRIPATPQITKLVERLQALNAESKTVTSRQRRGIRKKIQNAHRRLKALCVPICKEIIGWVEENKALLVIDDLTCGGKTGSFGQDKMREILMLMCEVKKIPYLVNPTPYTSRTCNNCGTLGDASGKPPKYRPDPDTFICEECGKLDAQSNGAKNVARFGNIAWKEGIPSLNTRVKKAIETNKFEFDETPIQSTEPKKNVL